MRRLLKAAAFCGIGGPVLFAGVLAVLSFLEKDFMRALGWDPLTAATRDWPSGLALGPGGFVMTAAFIACGVLLLFFAFGLWQAFQAAPVSSAASIFLALAGLAMSFLAFTTDPTNSRAPATLHGRMHDAAFVVLGVTLLVSLVAFGFIFRTEKKWRANMVVSWVTAALIVPSFIVKGIAFYFFLAACLLWCEAAAVRLLRRTGAPPT
ncbi:MAG: DUF998 domain-containing protein [Spirochaetia bacterium]